MKKEEEEWKTKEDRWTIKKKIDLKEVRRRKLEEIAWIIIIITAAGGRRRGTSWRLLYCCLYSTVCSHTAWSVGRAVS